MYGSLDISTSGMIAQRTRLQVIAANIANRNAILDSAGNVDPYRRRIIGLAPGDPTATTPEGRAMGVHVAAIDLDSSPLQMASYDPENPHAYKSGPNAGYVPGTNVNPVWEQVNAMEASRAYEANVVAAEAAKTMMGQALRLLA